MTEQEYIDYFEGLASRHTAILHTAEQPRFFVAHDNNYTEVDKKVRSGLRLPAVVLDQYYDDLDRSQDNFRLRIMGGLSILVKCRAQDPLDVRRARQVARQIALSFINRMYRDCRQPTGLLFGHRIVPTTRFEGEPTQTIAEIATGWGYPFEWQMPTTVALNSDDWTDL